MTQKKAKQKAVAAIRTIVEAAKKLAKAEEIYYESPSKYKQEGKRKCS